MCTAFPCQVSSITGHAEGTESIGVRLGLGLVGRVLGPNRKGPGHKERGGQPGCGHMWLGREGLKLRQKLSFCCAALLVSFHDLPITASKRWGCSTICMCMLGIWTQVLTLQSKLTHPLVHLPNPSGGLVFFCLFVFLSKRAK